MEPKPDLPTHFQHGERRAVIPLPHVVGLVTATPNIIKDLRYITRNTPSLRRSSAQTIAEVILGFLGRCIKTDTRRQQLRQQLGKLAQLE